MQQHILRGLLSGTPAYSSSAPDRSHPITRTVLRDSERPCLAHRLSAANCSILLVIASHRPTGRSHPRQGSSDDYALHYRTKTGARSEAHTTIGRALDRIGHRSPCLEGMTDASPRLDLSGPLVDQKLFFLQDDEYFINKREVYTLPFPFNQTTSTAINSFTQFAAILSPNQTLTASFHLAPHLLTYSGLDYFNPQAADLGMVGRVRFLGDRRDIPAIMASLDLTVLPSASESLSNAIIESMGARRSSDCNPCRLEPSAGNRRQGNTGAGGRRKRPGARAPTAKIGR